jgi:hypothetical protein
MGSRIVVGGPKLRLTAASAQAIGFALHELKRFPVIWKHSQRAGDSSRIPAV